ncbi:MAG: M67 family metallopeptidase [Candidatus Omnitrophica bacterium]|nr:M67 family metallopeptidase [Candidatus Omnitrophota bacterium]
MLRIPQALYDETVSHCRSEYPKEACGMLAGRGGSVEAVYRMRNVDESPISYAMDPKEQLQVMKRMRQANQEMLAIYHSHTASDAYPSPVDVRLAVYPDVAYVLVSLKRPDQPAVHSYRIIDGQISQDDLQVLP